jgi:tripartite-type tricarboxylate transporter receptor subunit TctC
VEKGNIKPLAVTSAQRVPDLPRVPTVIEAGMPELNVFTWTALFVLLARRARSPLGSKAK